MPSGIPERRRGFSGCLARQLVLQSQAMKGEGATSNMARWRGSETERLLEENARCFRWLGLATRFLLEYLGGTT